MTMNAGVCTAPVVNLGMAKPVFLLPALIFTCWIAVQPTKSACEGDLVPVRSDGLVVWQSPFGEHDFVIGDEQLPKEVCIFELSKEDAIAFATDNQIAWDDYQRWLVAQNN